MIYKPLSMRKEGIHCTQLLPRLRGLTGNNNKTSVRTECVKSVFEEGTLRTQIGLVKTVPFGNVQEADINE